MCDAFAAPAANCALLTAASCRCRAIAFIARALGGLSTQEGVYAVKLSAFFAAAVIAASVCPLAAHAQGVPDGISHGVYEGNRVAGPIGAVVGGAVGGVLGGIGGVLGAQPTYAAYSEGAPPRAYHRRHYARHSARRHHYAPQS